MATLQNTTINDTGFLTLAGGSTAQRPSPTAGMIRLNTSNNLLEFYDATGWRPITGISKGSIGTGGNSILYAASNLGRVHQVVAAALDQTVQDRTVILGLTIVEIKITAVEEL